MRLRKKEKEKWEKYNSNIDLFESKMFSEHDTILEVFQSYNMLPKTLGKVYYIYQVNGDSYVRTQELNLATTINEPQPFPQAKIIYNYVSANRIDTVVSEPSGGWCDHCGGTNIQYRLNGKEVLNYYWDVTPFSKSDSLHPKTQFALFVNEQLEAFLEQQLK